MSLISTMKEIVANMLIQKRKWLLLSFFILYVFYILVLLSTYNFSFFTTLIILLLPFLIYEFLLRVLLFFAFGRTYRYVLFNYFIVDHPRYGNTFRKNIHSQDIEFPIYDKFIFKPESNIEFDLARNKETRTIFSINSLGFRGNEFSQKKQKKIRIFCSGGSTTACNSVNDNDTWSSVLSRVFAKKNYDIEVINAGVQGWSSLQELRRFTDEIINYNPDVVLLHQGWNEEFAYSSQNLGKWWKLGEVRNMIETRYLYSGRSRIFSNTTSILYFFTMLLYFRDIVFNRNMKFTNPERWKCLKQSAYKVAWFDTMTEFAREAKRRNILLYIVNYPGLCNFDDSTDEREIYVNQTRLTELFADYQAISKKQIQKTLSETSPIIPCLDIEKQMNDIRGEDRLKLFIDEIHLSPEGNTMLGEVIANQLITDKDFKNLTEDRKKKSNVTVNESEIEKIREDVAKNYSYIDEFISSTIEKLKQRKRGDDRLELPTERYTTF